MKINSFRGYLSSYALLSLSDLHMPEGEESKSGEESQIAKFWCPFSDSKTRCKHNKGWFSLETPSDH